jgi:uncharacterized membrane protein
MKNIIIIGVVLIIGYMIYKKSKASKEESAEKEKEKSPLDLPKELVKANLAVTDPKERFEGAY